MCGNDQVTNGPCTSQVSLDFNLNCEATENHQHPGDLNGVGCNQSPSSKSFSVEIMESYKNIMESMESQLVQAEKLLGGD